MGPLYSLGPPLILGASNNYATSMHLQHWCGTQSHTSVKLGEELWTKVYHQASIFGRLLLLRCQHTNLHFVWSYFRRLTRSRKASPSHYEEWLPPTTEKDTRHGSDERWLSYMGPRRPAFYNLA